MKRALVIFLLIASLLLSGCSAISFPGSGAMIRGSGNVITQNREVSGFTQIEFSGSGEAQITQGDTDSLTIEAEDNILPYLTSDVVNGKLELGMKPNLSISTTRPIRYTITVKNLSAVATSGSVNVSANAMNGETIVVTTSGSGNMTIDSAQGTSLSAESSGSGNITIATAQGTSFSTRSSGSGSIAVQGGKVDSQKVTLTGSGSYNAANLESQTAFVTTSGSGDAAIWAKTTLTGSTSGSSNIRYYGSPTVTVNASGSGRASNLGNK